MLSFFQITSVQEVIPVPSKRIYRRSKIKDVTLESLKSIAEIKGSEGVRVGLDIAKKEIVVVVRWEDGSFERPWSVANPSEISVLVELLCGLKRLCGGLTVGLESTGTYGDSVRFALNQAEIEVHRVSGKGVSDYKEIFDGVPSQHDGKDAAMIAELTHYGKGTPWPYEVRSESEQHLRRYVARLDSFRDQGIQWIGRLEAMLARHWPELIEHVQVSSSTVLNICVTYGSPAELAADGSARQQLRRWGGPRLRSKKIDAIIDSAKNTAGIPMGSGEKAWLQDIGQQVVKAREEVRDCEKKLSAIVKSSKEMQGYEGKIGVVTLCVIWSIAGNPANYSSSGAFLKALGLNLKEISSGKRNGRLAISKRGSGLVRKYLFLWAMRVCSHPSLKDWYTNFQRVGRSQTGDSDYRKMKALVALMRKLARGLWYCCKHDLPFEYAKVFPGKPLQPRRKRRSRRRVAV